MVMIGQTDLFAVLLLLWLVVFVCMGLDRLIRITGSRYMKLVEHTLKGNTHNNENATRSITQKQIGGILE